MRLSLDTAQADRLARKAFVSRVQSRRSMTALKNHLLAVIASPAGIAWSVAAGTLYGAAGRNAEANGSRQSARTALLRVSRVALLGWRLFGWSTSSAGNPGAESSQAGIE